MSTKTESWLMRRWGRWVVPYAALWITTLWRMESNGVPRDRMLAMGLVKDVAAVPTTSFPSPRAVTCQVTST